MEEIYKYRTNCINSSVTEGNYVREWADNQTTDEIIIMVPGPYIPHLFYMELNETHNCQYQFCGPMLLIAEYFAKFTKTKWIIITIHLRSLKKILYFL